MRALLFTAVIGVQSLTGCQASLKAEAKVQARPEPSAAELGFDKPLATEQGAPVAPAALEPLRSAPALLGARRDLSLANGDSAVACPCAKVALGTAQSTAFKWAAETPSIDEQNQLVIALEPDTSACPTPPKAGSNTSYWGYRWVGNDVVVYIENARDGIPKASGAIIPKPYEQGQVYVATVGSDGDSARKSRAQNARCKVGNPGPARAARPAAGPDPSAPSAANDDLHTR